jgi:hypothetical protein
VFSLLTKKPWFIRASTKPVFTSIKAASRTVVLLTLSSPDIFNKLILEPGGISSDMIFSYRHLYTSFTVDWFGLFPVNCLNNTFKFSPKLKNNFL